MATATEKKVNNSKAGLVMRQCLVTVKGKTPYSQSGPIQSLKQPDESHDEFEQRTWRERCRATPDGEIFITGDAFQKALAGAAAYMSEKIPGGGSSKWTKHFLSGVRCPYALALGVQQDEVPGVTILVSSDGKKKSSAGKVRKTFPVIHEWGGEIEFWVTDPKIQVAVFEKYMHYAGLNIGVGRWRPENGGSNGMFEVLDFKWSDV